MQLPLLSLYKLLSGIKAAAGSPSLKTAGATTTPPLSIFLHGLNTAPAAAPPLKAAGIPFTTAMSGRQMRLVCLGDAAAEAQAEG